MTADVDAALHGQAAAAWDQQGHPFTAASISVLPSAAIAIRPLRRGDAAALEDLWAGLSPRSRYWRFHAPVPALTSAMRRVLLDVDGRDHVAWVAETDQRGGGGRRRAVGIARLIRDPQAPGEAEVAIAVVDAWHRRGVGGRLLGALVETAQELGVSRLHAWVLADNLAVLGLIRAVYPARSARRDGGVVHLICVLCEPDVGEITMEDILADLAG